MLPKGTAAVYGVSGIPEGVPLLVVLMRRMELSMRNVMAEARLAQVGSRVYHSNTKSIQVLSDTLEAMQHVGELTQPQRQRVEFAKHLLLFFMDLHGVIPRVLSSQALNQGKISDRFLRAMMYQRSHARLAEPVLTEHAPQADEDNVYTFMQDDATVDTSKGVKEKSSDDWRSKECEPPINIAFTASDLREEHWHGGYSSAIETLKTVKEEKLDDDEDENNSGSGSEGLHQVNVMPAEQQLSFEKRSDVAEDYVVHDPPVNGNAFVACFEADACDEGAQKRSKRKALHVCSPIMRRNEKIVAQEHFIGNVVHNAAKMPTVGSKKQKIYIERERESVAPAPTPEFKWVVVSKQRSYNTSNQLDENSVPDFAPRNVIASYEQRRVKCIYCRAIVIAANIEEHYLMRHPTKDRQPGDFALPLPIMRCPCDHCDFMCQQVATMVKHDKLVHSLFKGWITKGQLLIYGGAKCPHCSFSFNNTEALNTHLMSAHEKMVEHCSALRLFACLTCKEEFRRLYEIYKHWIDVPSCCSFYVPLRVLSAQKEDKKKKLYY